jgi:hypothetical protein
MFFPLLPGGAQSCLPPADHLSHELIRASISQLSIHTRDGGGKALHDRKRVAHVKNEDVCSHATELQPHLRSSSVLPIAFLFLRTFLFFVRVGALILPRIPPACIPISNK